MHVGNNRIKELSPDHLKTYGLMSVLDLRDNKISELPDEIVHLKNLQRLDLTNNDLSRWAQYKGLWSYECIILDLKAGMKFSFLNSNSFFIVSQIWQFHSFSACFEEIWQFSFFFTEIHSHAWKRDHWVWYKKILHELEKYCTSRKKILVSLAIVFVGATVSLAYYNWFVPLWIVHRYIYFINKHSYETSVGSKMGPLLIKKDRFCSGHVK